MFQQSRHYCLCYVLVVVLLTSTPTTSALRVKGSRHYTESESHNDLDIGRRRGGPFDCGNATISLAAQIPVGESGSSSGDASSIITAGQGDIFYLVRPNSSSVVVLGVNVTSRRVVFRYQVPQEDPVPAAVLSLVAADGFLIVNTNVTTFGFDVQRLADGGEWEGLEFNNSSAELLRYNVSSGSFDFSTSRQLEDRHWFLYSGRIYFYLGMNHEFRVFNIQTGVHEDFWPQATVIGVRYFGASHSPNVISVQQFDTMHLVDLATNMTLTVFTAMTQYFGNDEHYYYTTQQQTFDSPKNILVLRRSVPFLIEYQVSYPNLTTFTLGDGANSPNLGPALFKVGFKNSTNASTAGNSSSGGAKNTTTEDEVYLTLVMHEANTPNPGYIRTLNVTAESLAGSDGEAPVVRSHSLGRMGRQSNLHHRGQGSTTAYALFAPHRAGGNQTLVVWGSRYTAVTYPENVLLASANTTTVATNGTSRGSRPITLTVLPWVGSEGTGPSCRPQSFLVVGCFEDHIEIKEATTGLTVFTQRYSTTKAHSDTNNDNGVFVHPVPGKNQFAVLAQNATGVELYDYAV